MPMLYPRLLLKMPAENLMHQTLQLVRLGVASNEYLDVAVAFDPQVQHHAGDPKTHLSRYVQQKVAAAPQYAHVLLPVEPWATLFLGFQSG